MASLCVTSHVHFTCVGTLNKQLRGQNMRSPVGNKLGNRLDCGWPAFAGSVWVKVAFTGVFKRKEFWW